MPDNIIIQVREGTSLSQILESFQLFLPQPHPNLILNSKYFTNHVTQLSLAYRAFREELHDYPSVNKKIWYLSTIITYLINWGLSYSFCWRTYSRVPLRDALTSDLQKFNCTYKLDFRFADTQLFNWLIPRDIQLHSHQLSCMSGNFTANVKGHGEVSHHTGCHSGCHTCVSLFSFFPFFLFLSSSVSLYVSLWGKKKEIEVGSVKALNKAPLPNKSIALPNKSITQFTWRNSYY